jgi:hypothetical protein
MAVLDWVLPLSQIRQSLQVGGKNTVFDAPPGKLAPLPGALGGDKRQWNLLAAPAKGKYGLFKLLEMKAQFFMLPQRLIAIMNTTRVRYLETGVGPGNAGETLRLESPRQSEIHIPGTADALVRSLWDIGQESIPDVTTISVLDTLYHEMTHAWLWLNEFYDAEIGDLCRNGVREYTGAKGVNGTVFLAYSAFTEAAGYYVGSRITRWCTALQDLDYLTHARPAIPNEWDTIAAAYDKDIPTRGIVNLGDGKHERIASPEMSDELRAAIDEKILEGLPLTRKFEDTPLKPLQDAIRQRWSPP